MRRRSHRRAGGEGEDSGGELAEGSGGADEKTQTRSASRAWARVEKLHQRVGRGICPAGTGAACRAERSEGFGSAGGPANDRRGCHGPRRDVERLSMAKIRAEARALGPDPNVEQRESATPRRPVQTLAPPTAEVVEVVDQGGQTPGPTAMSTAFVLRPFATCRPASCASGRGSGRAVLARVCLGQQGGGLADHGLGLLDRDEGRRVVSRVLVGE